MFFHLLRVRSCSAKKTQRITAAWKHYPAWIRALYHGVHVMSCLRLLLKKQHCAHIYPQLICLAYILSFTLFIIWPSIYIIHFQGISQTLKLSLNVSKPFGQYACHLSPISHHIFITNELRLYRMQNLRADNSNLSIDTCAPSKISHTPLDFIATIELSQTDRVCMSFFAEKGKLYTLWMLLSSFTQLADMRTLFCGGYYARVIFSLSLPVQSQKRLRHLANSGDRRRIWRNAQMRGIWRTLNPDSPRKGDQTAVM